MGVRSRRIFGPLILSPGWALAYTVPAGRTLIIDTIWWRMQGGSSCNVYIGLNGTGTSNQAYRTLIPGDRTTATPERQVWNPGDAIYVGQDRTDAGTVHVTAFGTLLLGAPS